MSLFYQNKSLLLNKISANVFRFPQNDYRIIPILRLLCFSQSINTIELKKRFFLKLSKMKESQLEKFNKILINELVIIFLHTTEITKENFMISIQNQILIWKQLLYEYSNGVLGYTNLVNSNLSHYCLGDKIIAPNSDRISLSTKKNKKLQDNTVFRSIIPVYSETHYDNLINSKIINNVI